MSAPALFAAGLSTSLAVILKCLYKKNDFEDHVFQVLVVGSTNPCKVNAVRSTLKQCYPRLVNEVRGCKVDTGVNDQPMSLEETIKGAKNRAEAVFKATAAEKGGVLCVGIESGVFKADDRFFDVCVCSTYDGERHSLGFSSSFEIPPMVAKFLQPPHRQSLAEACNSSKITTNSDIGQAEGCIGVVSRSNITRTGYTIQAVMTSLMAADPGWYPSQVPERGFLQVN
eukprot:TRINITY_DN15695_c0_g1_i2.p1 TRINITY_DN15695_c0_g1~~TRINITY_DN15695_c0_g1_i2.p1  ORF type:complete len:241 (+),score=35.44 TRINITY_DN15695_c0_g1_i2:45-725(+)